MTEKQHRYDQMYLDIVSNVARMSHSIRYKVGAIVVSNEAKENIVAFGWNGMPEGMPNECEFLTSTGEPISEIQYYKRGDLTHEDLQSFPEVKHAETNALDKLITDTKKTYIMYVSHNPCPKCATRIIDSKQIRRVVYRNDYVPSSRLNPNNLCGAKLLKEHGIEVVRKP